MSNFMVCVYATKDTPYVQVAESTILPSMKAIAGLKYSYSVVPNLGSWNKNTAYKATFALEMLAKYPTSNIVLLDVDCKINNYPSLFDNIPEQYNVAAHLLDWATWYKNGSTNKEFLTGTLWLRNCERTKYLVEKWIDGCEATNQWEQKVFEKSHGQLHKMLHVPLDRTIPTYMLLDIKEREVGNEIRDYKTTRAIKITKLMKKRALFLLNTRK